MPKTQLITDGLLKENPVLILGLGLCPALAVTTSAINGLGMGIATLFVLTCSNLLVSLIRRQVSAEVRIPVFIVVIATFVTIVEMVMKGYFPALNQALGLFIPLIVVNCIILGRAEAFAARNSLLDSLLDAIGMGSGFTLFLVLLGGLREVSGANKLLGYTVVPGLEPLSIMALAPGGFLALGLLLGLYNWHKLRTAKRSAKGV